MWRNEGSRVPPLAVIAALALLCVWVSGVAAADPRISVNLAQCCPPTQAYGVYAHGYADKVAKNSGGAIVVKNLDGGVMGSEQDMAQKVKLGTLNMAAVTSNNVAQLAPSINVLVLPYLNGSPAELLGEKGLLRPGPWLDELNKRVLKESGTVRIIGGFTNDFRKFFTKNKCVQTLADLQGLKIRMPKNPVMEKMWKAWGVSTYAISWPETFGAIQQGVVDAFDSPLDVIPSMGYHAHIKYVIDTYYLPQAALLIVNDRWWQGLTQQDRDLLLATAAENDVWHYNWVNARKQQIRTDLETKHGTKFCDLKDADEWRQRAQATWPELYSLVGGGKAWVDATLAYKKTGNLPK
jgi:TRAP-type C4-dicarboxylate transport system substrate-binding protein